MALLLGGTSALCRCLSGVCFLRILCVCGLCVCYRFLGYVNMIGVSYESSTVATGIGNYYALVRCVCVCKAEHRGLQMIQVCVKAW